MTPTFCCGFECGLIFATSNGGHFIAVSGGTAPTISTSTVRSGARSLKCAGVTSAAQTQTLPALDTWSTTAGAKNSGRVYVNFETFPGGDTFIVSHNGESPSVSGVYFTASDSKIWARANGTSGSSGIAVVTGQWYRIDVRFDYSFNSNAGLAVDVQVDGNACGQATNNTGSSLGSRIRLGIITNAGASGTAYFDDVITSQTAGDYPIGGGYVNQFIPTSDGTHNITGANEFERTLTGTDITNATTDAYQLIDDVPLESGAGVDWQNMVAPSSAAEYVECVFGPASGISTPTAGPQAVETIAGYHQAGTGAGNMELRMNDNGTTDAMYSATAVAGVTSIKYARKQYATAIAGGGAWTVVSGNGNFNNLRIRFGSPSGGVDANPDQYFDCIMIEADFFVADIIKYLLVKN